MSKAVKRDHEFNQEKFQKLLRTAQGHRNQTEFAADAGLSVAYVCKYLNGKFNRPPIPSTIRKITNASENRVAFADLMDAAGYDPNIITLPADALETEPKLHFTSDNKKTKLSLAIITSALAQSRFRWTTFPFQEQLAYDFGIKIEDNALISHWYFNVVTDFANVSPLNPFPNRLLHYYAKLVTTNLPVNTKYSFVAYSEETYENIKSITPFMVAMQISVILVDLDKMIIKKEEYLTSAVNSSSDVNDYLFLT